MIEAEIRRVISGESAPPSQTTSQPKLRIVIAQRGFVFAGSVTTEGDDIVIHDAVNIRKWGTSRGLGELAEKGNLPDTKADPAGTVTIHRLAVVAMIDCKEAISATA